MLKDEGYEWNDVVVFGKRNIIGCIHDVIQTLEGGEVVKEGDIFECRFQIFRQTAAANKCKFRNIDEEKDALFLKCLKIPLQNVTLLADKNDCKPDQQSRPVAVKHGRILGIYILKEQTKKGYLRSSDGTVIEFSPEHFAAAFPFPLRAGDDVSFLIKRNSLKARSKEDTNQEILRESIRVTAYNKPIDFDTANDFIQFLRGKEESDADIVHYIVESRCLPFLRGMFCSIESFKINSEFFVKTIMEMIRMFASCLRVRFPIDSEQEKDYNMVFGAYEEKSMDLSKQRRFLKIFIGCKIFSVISEAELDGQQSYVHTSKIILALLSEFPEEREHICNPVIKLISNVHPREKGYKIWNLIFFVISRPRADVYNQSWRNIPEMMSLTEFHARLQPKSAAGSHKPELKAVKATYTSREEYCDTYYKLLREDTYRELSSAINRWIQDRRKYDSDAVYDIEFCGIEESTTGAQGCNCCRVHYYPLTPALRQEGKEYSRFLRCGNLFCISPSGKFRSDVKGDVLFAIKEPETRKLDRYVSL